MIYELKVSIEDISPVAWRKIQVEENISLLELHQIIQAAFEWEDSHLHEFHVLQSDGKEFGDFLIRIGTSHPDMEQSVFGSSYQYDEATEKLSDWLKKEQDKLLYVYDFGDDWQHEVTLENILPDDSSFNYPSCKEASGAAPEEDSRFFWLGGGKVKKPLPEKLIDEVNQRLSSIRIQGNQEEKAPSAELLLGLANEFKALQAWTYMADEEIFGVELPNGEFVWCSVLGNAGEEFGLSIFVGNEGWDTLDKMMFSEEEIDLIREFNGLLLSFSDRNELNKKDYQLIKDQGFSYRGKKQWPQFRRFTPGKLPWNIGDDDIDLLCLVLKQAVYVCSKAREGFPIPEFGEEELFVRFFEGENNWRDGWFSITQNDEEELPVEYPMLVNELELQKIRKNLQHVDESLEIGIIESAVPVQDNKDEAPYLPLIFLAVERKSGLILFHQFMTHDDVLEQIQSTFLDLMTALEAIPREIQVDEASYPVLKQVTDKLDIQLSKANSLPAITEIKKGLQDDVF